MSAAAIYAAPDRVILVRHAEKGDAPKDDPVLTAAGRERAAELAKTVALLTADAPVQAIFTTKYARTRETAAPLAARFRVKPVETNDDPVAQVLAVKGGTVVIVGHSNTIPGLLKELGIATEVQIADGEFRRLWVVARPGTPKAEMVEITFGK